MRFKSLGFRTIALYLQAVISGCKGTKKRLLYPLGITAFPVLRDLIA